MGIWDEVGRIPDERSVWVVGKWWEEVRLEGTDVCGEEGV